MNNMGHVRPLVFAAIINVNIHAAYYVGSVHDAGSLTRAHNVQSCTCPPGAFCVAPDTIACAKVSGADSIAWWTQLPLTPSVALAQVA